MDTRLKLEAGSTETRVPVQARPRLEIQTPVGKLGVRGTDFRTRISGGQVLLEVLEGQVAVFANAPNAAFTAATAPTPTTASTAVTTTTGAGFGTVISAQGVSEPRRLLA